MEKSTPIGLIAGVLLIFGAIILGEGWATFFSFPSFLLVAGGTAAALLVNFPLADLRQVPSGIMGLFTFSPPNLPRYIDQFVDLSRTARRDGLLALDRRLSEVDDPLMRFGIEMAVDGIDEREIAGMIGLRVRENLKRKQFLAKFFTSAGTYAPAFGMVGTLIGLIQMLQNLSDPTQIGSGMSVALITTFYGALSANLVFLPTAAKVRSQMAEQTQLHDVIRTGILAIVRGDSPTMLERRLQTFVQDGASYAKAA